MEGRFEKVIVYLRDADDHEELNIRVMDYLNDRYRFLNDAGFVIAIEVIDDSNINKFMKQGISSVPAIRINEETDFGASNVMAALARLEMVPKKTSKSAFEEKDPVISHHERMLQEMLSDEPEDDKTPSSIKLKNQDIADSPHNKNELQQKLAQYDSIYSSRLKKSNMQGRRSNVSAKKVNNINNKAIPTAKENVEKLIRSEGFDKGEAAFMREIARNIEYE
jgi:hypothetical protein